MAPNHRQNYFLFLGREGGKQLKNLFGFSGEHSGALRRILRRKQVAVLFFSWFRAFFDSPWGCYSRRSFCNRASFSCGVFRTRSCCWLVPAVTLRLDVIGLA